MQKRKPEVPLQNSCLLYTSGTFLVVGLTEDDFTSLTPEQIEKFKEKYQSPEAFTLFNGELHVMKMPPEEAKEQKEKQKKDAQQKNPAKEKKKRCV